MTSLALSSPSSALKQETGSSEIRARIAEHVGVDLEYINDDSDLNEDLGLDLLDVMELVILLEDIFVDGRVNSEADGIEFVGDLIRHIERHQECARGLVLNQLMRQLGAPHNLEGLACSIEGRKNSRTV
jgi:acyl carrier protein